MEIILIVALAVGLLVFLSMMAAFAIGGRRGAKRATEKIAVFQRYLAQQFPDLPAPAQMLCAARQSTGKRLDVALVVAEPRGEIIVILDDGPQGMHHFTEPFAALVGTRSTGRIISRGMPTAQVFSYEQTMTVDFADGTSIPFTLETISNRQGSDGAPATVAGWFAPWEQRLNSVRTTGTPPPAPAPPPSVSTGAGTVRPF